MYRACSTWQYTVAAHLVERYRDGKRLGYLSGEEYTLRRGESTANAHAPMAIGSAGGRSGWTVFKSHDGDRFFARAMASGQARVLYAYRDVRDVIFSLMHKRGLTFEQLLRQGMIQQILWNDRFWTRRSGVLIQKYEDLIADPVTGVLQIARHLEIPIEAYEASQIAVEYSADSNRARIENLQKTLRESGVDLNDASNQQICDPTTLLHWNHLRPRTETWRDLATPSQRRLLESYFGDWLAARGYARDDSAHTERPTWQSRLGELRDIAQGWTACRLHAATLSYPRQARLAKRLLGRGDAHNAGAVNWQESAGERSDRSIASR